MKSAFTPVLSVVALSLFPLCGSGADSVLAPWTTRQQTIRPLALSDVTPSAAPKEVVLYKEYGYSSWQPGPGEDQGRRLDLTPSGYKAAPNVARLLTFFSMSDVHITDKESPAQVPYFGWSAAAGSATLGLYSQAYSPVILSTTQVLDATVRTINALHGQTPFDFGIVLGDVANNSQYNELRWFIDVMDGAYITPSSGDHRGAESIAYQKPFRAAGLDRSIPWYEVIGNHDQFWMGVIYPNTKLTNAFVSSNVLDIGPSLFKEYNMDATGVYVGVVDGTTPYGDVIKGGPEANFITPPTIVADANRRTMTTADSSVSNFIGEFARSTSFPAGHGFSSATSACYTFEPKSDLPLKVIVLDDTCKSKGPSGSPSYFGSGWIDAERFAWLTSELQKGQDAGQLMIIAAHIPVNPQKDLFDTSKLPQFYPASYKNDADLVAALHAYPNLIMFIAGHRHLNVVTPQPSSDLAHPEYGFWEVETPSLRDYPRQFRTYDIRRNSDQTISILVTDVDTQTEVGSPAADSLGYAIGAYKIFGNGAISDTGSHSYNAELVKVLSKEMQQKLAALGTPLPQDKAPVITLQPASKAGNAGSTTSFSVVASSPLSLSYQWQGTNDGGRTWSDLRDGSAYFGSNSSSLTLLSTTMDMAGLQFRCVLNDGVNLPLVTQAATLSVQWSQLVNVSIRGNSGTSSNILIGGFSLSGTGTKTMLVRGVGPALTAFGVGGVLADPGVVVYNRGGTSLAINNDWGGGSALSNAFASAGAFGFPSASKDAALLLPLSAGLYSAQVAGSSGTSGVALAEIYDTAPADLSVRLVNSSGRAVVSLGNQLIAGMTLSGARPLMVLVRAIGPALMNYGVANPLANPRLRIYDSSGVVIASNDDWAGTAALTKAFAKVGAFSIPSASKDSALLVTLTSGSYTAVVDSVDGSSGVALVEIYVVE